MIGIKLTPIDERATLYLMGLTRDMKTNKKTEKFLSVPIGWPAMGREEIKAVLKTLKEERLSQGKYVKAFEETWSRYVGRKFGIAVNSGSSANFLALLAMKERYGWRNGEAIIAPALTFATAVMPVLQARLRPVFADVDTRGNMTFRSIVAAFEKHRDSKIRGVVLVHSLGVPCVEIAKIKNWAGKNGLKILEDACESHGAKVGNKRVGAFGDASTTSFFVAHNMTTGEGGMINTDDPELDKICRSLREFGRHIGALAGERYVALASGPKYDLRYAFDRLGYNMRMTDLEATFGLVQFTKLDKFNLKRREIVAAYRRELKNLVAKKLIFLPEELKNSFNTYYALQITFTKMPERYSDLASIGRRLAEAGIETRPFMGGNLLRQKAFHPHKLTPEHFNTAEYLHHHAILVGCHPLLDKKQIRHTAEAIESLYTLESAVI